MTNPYTAEVRQSRRQTQADHLATVMSLPDRARGGALFALWPGKLPRSVRRAITPQVLAAWRRIRAIVEEHKLRAFIESMDGMRSLLHLDDDEEDGYVGAQTRASIELMMLEHKDQVNSLQQLVVSISQLKQITIGLSNGKTRKFDLEDGHDHEDDIILGFCMAMDMGGGITLRQTLSLRTQVKNDQGEIEWRAQERVYGIHCDEGQWEGITAAQMRAAYEHDQEGNKLGPDPLTSFGNAKDLIRTLGS